MRVGVNLIAVRPGVVGGLETYVQGLLGAMARLAGVEVSVFGSADTVRSLSAIPGLDAVTLFEGPYSVRQRFVAEAFLLPRALREHPIDVLFTPSAYSPLRAPRSIPQVVTIHDVQHLVFPQYFTRGTRMGRAALHWHTVRRSDRIIAISEVTRQDLLARLPLTPDRVITVHSGVEPRSRPPSAELAEVRARYRLPRRFIYFPATLATHKNHPFLFEVVSRLAREPDAPHLVLTGKLGPEWQALQALAQRLGIHERVMHLGFLPYADVWRILSAAEALVFPSQFEGFGFPVIEGQQAGVPVIASDVPALREVLRESAEILPLGDPEVWARAITALLRDPARRERLIALGAENAQRFTWARCAEQTLEVLRGCVGGAPGISPSEGTERGARSQSSTATST